MQACGQDTKNVTRTEMESCVNLMPFSIDYTGNAPINSYFRVADSGKAGQSKAFFRGREVVGSKLSLPSSVTGSHLVRIPKQIESSHDDVNAETWEELGHFKEFFVWQHDVAPSLTHIEEIFDWFEVADTVRK